MADSAGRRRSRLSDTDLEASRSGSLHLLSLERVYLPQLRPITPHAPHVGKPQAQVMGLICFELLPQQPDSSSQKGRQGIMASSNPNQPSGPHGVGEHIVPPPRPSSPATAEYRLNHLMVRIKNPEKSLKFYCDCMGMHVVFIFNAGPWTIYYLGPRDTSK